MDTEAIQIRGLQREEKGDNNESGCSGYTDQRQREEKGDNNRSGYKGYLDQGSADCGKGRQQRERMKRLYRARVRRGRRRATIKIADREAVQINGQQREEKGHKGYTDQRPADGGKGR